jgi:DNA-binding NarL/FixJ family response regulator
MKNLGFMGYPNYAITEDGKVFSFLSKRFLKSSETISKNKVITLRVNLFNEDGPRTIETYKLVANAFIPNPDNLPVINHKDGDRRNNCVANLEWCTQEHNMRHAVKTGLLKTRSLTEETAHKILEMMEEGYRNIDIAEISGIDYKIIAKIRQGENYRPLWEQYDIPSKKQTVSVSKVTNIKKLLNEGVTVEKIAKTLNVSRNLIKDIRDGRRFAHI